MSMFDIVVPIEQEGTKAVVRSWLKAVGESLEVNDPLVELETDKVTQEVPAPVAGVLEEIILQTDDEAEPGSILGRIRLEGDIAASAAKSEIAPHISEPSSQASVPTSSSKSAKTFLSPAVRRALKRTKIDPNAVEGTGRGGRITLADVERAEAQGVPAAKAPAPAPRPSIAPSPAPAGVASHAVPHDRMRIAIAQNMLNSVTVAPHVTAVFELDLTAIMAHRAKHKAEYASKGVKLTYTAYFLAACAEAMKVSPTINSQWFDDRLEVFDDINIGVGASLGDKGLVVPVVPRVQDLSLFGIAQRLTDVLARARSNQLSPGDVKGGTFTISNHGVSGSLLASPIIINQPQSAILGVGKTEKRVVVREVDGADTIQIRPMAYVSLTIDHRVVDGHQTNAWLTKFVETLEQWSAE